MLLACSNVSVLVTINEEVSDEPTGDAMITHELVAPTARHELLHKRSLEVVELVVVLHELLKQDADSSGIIQNGLLPSEYVKQLHAAVTAHYEVSIEETAHAFKAMMSLGLRSYADSLYGAGMEVSKVQIEVNRDQSLEREIDRLGRELADVLEENLQLTEENQQREQRETELVGEIMRLNARLPDHDSEETQ